MSRYLFFILTLAVIQITFSIFYAGQIVNQNLVLNQQETTLQNLYSQNLQLKASFYQNSSIDKIVQYQKENLLYPIEKNLKLDEKTTN